MGRAYYIYVAVVAAFLLGWAARSCTTPSPCHSSQIGQWCDYQHPK